MEPKVKDREKIEILRDISEARKTNTCIIFLTAREVFLTQS